jgi:hypothetical protein
MPFAFLAKTLILSLFFTSCISILKYGSAWAVDNGRTWARPFWKGLEDMDAGFFVTWMVLFVLFLIVQLL